MQENLLITSKNLAPELCIPPLLKMFSHSLPDCLGNQADRSGATLVVNHRLREF